MNEWMNEWTFNDTPARKTDRLLGVKKRVNVSYTAVVSICHHRRTCPGSRTWCGSGSCCPRNRSRASSRTCPSPARSTSAVLVRRRRRRRRHRPARSRGKYPGPSAGSSACPYLPITDRRKRGNVLFNDALDTFENERKKERKKER